LDDVSEPITVNGGVAVFKLSMVREEGVRPFDEVKSLARTMVVRKKKMEKAGERAQAFYNLLTPSADLLAAAARLGPAVTARSTGPFKASSAPAGIGRDLAFIGVAESLTEGEISKPFEGARGYYILKLTTKSPFDSTQYASQKSDLRDEILREKKSRFSQDWVTALREKADIEDYRDRFFR
jgi:parvulin-like peptidyl-prolyl isomerase